MLAKKLDCKVVTHEWLTPTVLRIRLQASRRFTFEAGQFVSIIIPSLNKKAKPIKRLYSISSSPEEASEGGLFELCVKYVEGGVGSEYVRTLEVGDRVQAYAPYGDFVFHPAPSERLVMLISTGTGIAPMRAIALSKVYHDNAPAHTICLHGVREETERLFEKDFHSMGIETVYAVSRPGPGYRGFTGRVSDYLKSLPESFPWHSTDFYLCGNGEMLAEVDAYLRSQRGVSAQSIYKESFSSPQVSKPGQPPERPNPKLVSFPHWERRKRKREEEEETPANLKLVKE